MMFFANSVSTRPRLKLKPPKTLVYSLCLVTLLMILLTAQLRAIELAEKNQKHQPEHSLTEISNQNESETGNENEIENANRTTTTKATRQDNTIDRDDRVNTYEPDVPQTDLKEAAKRRPEADLGPTNATENANGAQTTSAANTTQTGEDLLLSPTNIIGELQAASDYADQQHLPSLAELTAAGTAAGLLIHDLAAQANMVEQFPYEGMDPDQQNVAGNGPETPPREAADNDDNESLSNSLDPAAHSSGPPSDIQQMLMSRKYDQQQEQSDEHSDGRPSLVDQQQQYQGGHQAANLPLRRYQSASLESAEAAPEPPNEDQMPDSIESLMGVDEADGQQQQPADSNLINQSNEQLASSAARQQLVAPATGDDNDGDTDDDADQDDETGSGNSAVHLQQAGSKINRRNNLVPVLMSAPQQFPSGELRAGSGGEFEQNLVAPMRDSLVDLNAAAGHYYGKKKKKKKVKKIIIKKKKKKYKKVKIVKIKKKKKKKKIVKKKKPKKMHHHDHGKYYMYAKVPKKKAWEFGFKKGNNKHWIERHEKGHKNKFKTKVMWYDKKSKGKGLHIWDYNHHDKKKKKHY